MHQNALQWCADWYGRYYYHESPTEDPKGPNTGSERVIRGSSWGEWTHDSCSAGRIGSRPDLRDLFTGFRVTMSH